MSWKDKFIAAERDRNKKDDEEYEGTLYAYYKGMKWWKSILEGFKVLAKTYLPTLLITVSVMLLFSIIVTLALTNWHWGVAEKTFPLLEIINKYPEGTLLTDFSAEDQELYNALYPIYRRSSSWFNIVSLFVNYLPVGICGVIVSKYTLEKAKGNDVKFFDTVKQTFDGNKIKVTLLIMLILSALISIGFAFYFIPGIIILIMVGLCFPTLADTDKGIKDVLNDGFQLGKEFRLRTTILVIITVAFFSFFGNNFAQLFFSPIWNDAVRQSWLDPATRNWGMIFYTNIMNFTTTAVFLPIIYAFFAVHYLELGVQKNVEWFDFTPLTKKKVVEIETKDLLMNIIPFAIFTVISVVLSVFMIIENIQARLA